MDTIILVIIVVVFVSVAIVTFLLFKRRSRKRKDNMYGPIRYGPIMYCPSVDSARDGTYKGDTELKADLATRREQERKEAELAAKRESFKQKYKISVAHPRLLSKGYASLFVVQIYLPSLRLQAKRAIIKDLPIKKVTEHLRDIELEKGLKVRIKLSSPVLSFSDPVIKQIENGLTTTYFTAMPSENCRPGSHSVVLSVVDVETQVEYLSTNLDVRVVDFAFDHVSRPLLSKAMSAVLGLGSLTMFVLTALEQVDKAFGLTAGTAAAVLTSTILLQWWSIFQRPGVTHTP